MSGLLIDIAPLRKYPQFRRLWTGYLVRQFGAQVAVTTVIYQIFVITHSNLAVGLLGLAQFGPAFLSPLVGGAIADAIDRRIVLVVTALLIAVCSIGLAINTDGGHPALWPLYVCSAATWGLANIDAPTRTTVMMTLVDRDSFRSANVLRQLITQISTVAGPSLAGLLIALFAHHLALVYWVDVVSTIAALQAVLRLPPLRPEGGGTKFSLQSIGEGVSFVRHSQIILGCFIADLDATILGSPVSLFPFMAFDHFHGGSKTFGLLTASPAIGAFIGSVFSGWTARIKRQGFAVLVAIVVWGFATITFGFAPWMALGVVALAISGWANAVSGLFRNTMIQLEAPDELRGRLSSIQIAVASSGPRLGNTEAGIVASLTNTQFSIVSGGIGCIIGILALTGVMPKFRSYQADTRERVRPTSPDETKRPEIPK